MYCIGCIFFLISPVEKAIELTNLVYQIGGIFVEMKWQVFLSVISLINRCTADYE